MRRISYDEGIARGFSADEALEVVKDAIGDQYDIKKLKNNQIWANESSGDNDSRSFEGTPEQNAFNRIMKKIALEDGNEFNSQYRNRGEGTRPNDVIDWAVQNNVIHSNIKSFLNSRAEGRDSIKSGETPNEKLSRTLKERYWGTDSLTGANISGLVTDVGHIRAGANYADIKHHYSNTREEPASDNRAYQNLEGQELLLFNDKKLQESASQGVDVEGMESAIQRQMVVDMFDSLEDQAVASVVLGLANPQDVGLTKAQLDSAAVSKLKDALEVIGSIL